MARLGSLASVLAALDSGDEESSAHPAPGREATRNVQTSAAGTQSGQPGYEIWDSARRQAQFYATYAEMLETDDRRAASEAWSQDVYPVGTWVGLAALATSYRRAAQHAALVDARWAAKLAVRAGMAYVAAGSPFGLFLLTGLLDDQTLGDSDAVGDIVGPFRASATSDEITNPAQLVYLLMAAASRPWLRESLGETLSGAEHRLAMHSLYPVGAQGVPLGEYLDLANAMRHDDAPVGSDGRTGPVMSLARRLSGLHRVHAVTLRAAQRNRYLWRQGASQTSIIDLEHVAASGLALRHQPWFGELSDAIVDELSRDDELAQLPVWTMGSIETALPEVTASVTEIIRQPETAWRTEDLRDPEFVTDPWDGESPSDLPYRSDGPPRRGLDRRPDQFPGWLPGSDGYGDGEDGPTFRGPEDR